MSLGLVFETHIKRSIEIMTMEEGSTIINESYYPPGAAGRQPLIMFRYDVSCRKLRVMILWFIVVLLSILQFKIQNRNQKQYNEIRNMMSFEFVHSTTSTTNDYLNEEESSSSMRQMMMLQNNIENDNNNNNNNKKPYMIIHVGPPKTATSTLQHAFKDMDNKGIWSKDKYEYDTDLFVRTIMNKACHKQLWDVRKAHHKKDDDNNNTSSSSNNTITLKKNYDDEEKIMKYNISEEDLINKLKQVPCWENTLEEIQPYLANKTNLFASAEPWSFTYDPLIIETGVSMVDWTTIKWTLQKDWNLMVVFTYRRFPEWIFSSHQQFYRFKPAKQNLRNWPSIIKQIVPSSSGSSSAGAPNNNNGGGSKFNNNNNNTKTMINKRLGSPVGKKVPPISKLPVRRQNMKRGIPYRYADDLKKEMDRNVDIPYKIFNMHNIPTTGGLVSSFVCGILPNTITSCQYSLDNEKQQRQRQKQIQIQNQSSSSSDITIKNPSESLYYDALAVAAYEKGWIDPMTYKRHGVVKSIENYWTKDLNRNPNDFPLICPPQHQYRGFLMLSLSLEREILPQFSSLPNTQKDHYKSYWDQVKKNKFCYIDTKKALETILTLPYNSSSNNHTGTTNTNSNSTSSITVSWKEFFQERYASPLMKRLMNQDSKGLMGRPLQQRQPGNNNVSSNQNKTLSSFLFHIPKTGGEYGMYTLQSMLNKYFRQNRIPKAQQYRACNHAKEPIENFDTRYRYHYQGTKCTMWMSEVRYNEMPIKKYTILRDPRQHVLSQYFHCSESKDHGQWQKQQMPSSLDMWLQNWLETNHKVQRQIASQNRNNRTYDDDDDDDPYDPISYTQQAIEYQRQTSCYNPTNLQSYFLKFDVNKQTKDDLSRKFDVLGDNSQMTKTVCMIVIDYTNGRVIPPECDCSSRTSSFNNSNTTSQSITPNEQQQQTQQQRTLINYDPTKHSHGVQHHGATYNTTMWQDLAIRNLTYYDQILYNWAQDIFQQQVLEVESKYRIKICD